MMDDESVCMITVMILTSMQLIGNEEKRLGDKYLVLFAAILRIAANYCFHGYNFLRGHEHGGIK